MKVQECKKRHSLKKDNTTFTMLTDQARVQKKQSDKKQNINEKQTWPTNTRTEVDSKRKKKNTKMTILSRKLTSQATQTKESKQTGTN